MRERVSLFLENGSGCVILDKKRIRKTFQRRRAMCRNIKTLFNFDPPATDEEIQAASLQYVRKLSGFQSPSKANEEAFNLAIAEVAAASRKLLDSLVTNSSPRDREIEAQKAKERSAKRFGTAEA